MRDQRHILIAGVGNLLLRDDGVAVRAVHELQRQPIPGVVMADIGTAILHGLSLVENARRVLVIDAAQGGHAPGTIYLYDPADHTQPRAVSSIHALGLAEAMRLLSPTLAPPITILGVEPQALDYGMDLSWPVQAVLPRVVALARKTVLEWTRTTTTAHQSSLRAEPIAA